MAKVIQQHDKCIGCGTCVAVCPAFWQMSDDGKAQLKSAKDVKYELKIISDNQIKVMTNLGVE